jgi:hypothetical protein
MRGKSRGRGRGWLLGVLVATACGQELVLPDAAQRAPTTPSEGVTGVAGAADDSQPPARLPVTSEPVFTTFGGAGGESTASAEGGDASTSGGSSASGSGPGAASGGRLNAAGGASGSVGGGSGAAGRGSGSAGGGSGGKGTSGGAAGVGAQSATVGGGSGGAAGASGGGIAGAAGAASALGHALLFSEYVEGSGSAKALEIAALEAASLEGCELETYFNGKTEPSRIALHGQLAQGEVQVLCSSELAKTLPTVCSRATSLTFNGDDAVALSCDGVLLDFIGELGVDPGEGWDMNATLDHTLRRRCEITLGRREPSTPFVVDPEWTVWGRDTFSDLGARGCSP